LESGEELNGWQWTREAALSRQGPELQVCLGVQDWSGCVAQSPEKELQQLRVNRQGRRYDLTPRFLHVGAGGPVMAADPSLHNRSQDLESPF
jgi:hypothetical protein